MSVTKEATSKETTIVLAGLLTQAELLSLALPLEFTWVPEGGGEELDLEDEDDGPEGWGIEGVGVGEEPSCGVEVEPGVFEGGLPGTEVGWTSGFETLEEPGLAGSDVEDPPVIVKTGEMLPELPITIELKFNMTLGDCEGAVWVGLRAMIYVSLSGYWEGTTRSTFPAVMGKPWARGVSGEGRSAWRLRRRECDVPSCRLSRSPSDHPSTTFPMGFVIWSGKSTSRKVRVNVEANARWV